MSMYRTSPPFTGLRADGMLGGRCGRCEFRRACGGSRSRAYHGTGNPFAEEPLCRYAPGSFPYQREVAARLYAGEPAEPETVPSPSAARDGEDRRTPEHPSAPSLWHRWLAPHPGHDL
ncbi:hypothetical protein ABT404_15105 [Streptomyces hyaluromycini]|uniref:Uncharacterized protein n=1 Tax=Streptomyces hyaluromycini TaxID=1377993 RepID=A0ABV1WVL4_9ACTN